MSSTTITSRVTAQTSTHTVAVAVTGTPTIEAGLVVTPETFEPTGACITYTDGQVTALTILTTTDDLGVDLDDPSEWEPWLRDLVEQHRPALGCTCYPNPGDHEDRCPQSAAR